MKCDSPGFAVELLNELVRAFLAAADTRSQVYCSANIEYISFQQVKFISFTLPSHPLYVKFSMQHNLSLSNCCSSVLVTF